MKTAVVGGVVSALTTWLLQEFWNTEVLKHLLSLLYSFLPVWVGLIVFGAVRGVRDYLTIRRWLHIDAPQVETFRRWLRSRPEHSYEASAKRSLDDRILAMLEWWKSLGEPPANRQG